MLSKRRVLRQGHGVRGARLCPVETPVRSVDVATRDDDSTTSHASKVSDAMTAFVEKRDHVENNLG